MAIFNKKVPAASWLAARKLVKSWVAIFTNDSRIAEVVGMYTHLLAT